MIARKERRRKTRLPVGEKVGLSWVDASGGHHFAQAICLDASETGMRLELPNRIDEGSYITIKVEKYQLNASVRVRHVSQKGTKYKVGVEFNSGWHWKNVAQVIPAETP